MPIFRRENDDPAPGSPSTPRGAEHRGKALGGPTLIAAGTRVTGEITGATEVTVEGDVEGEVRVDSTVTIGSQGRIAGRVIARVVRAGGQVKGDLRGLDRVEVLPSGRIEGDISAPRVVIAEGAYFKGSVEMGTAQGTSTTGAGRPTGGTT